MSTEAVELSRQECTELIADGGIGRVVLCSDPGPQVYPVTFIVDRGDVIFRTSSYTALGTALHDRRWVWRCATVHSFSHRWAGGGMPSRSVVRPGPPSSTLRR